MKLEISVNFDFGKLAGKTKNIIDDYTAGYAQDSEQASKDNIDAGLSPDIKQSTKKHRQRKGSPTRPPLKASGKMYNSIKSDKNSLRLLEYGYFHHTGKVPTTVARPFISTSAKNKQKLDKKFMQDIQKALRSNKKVVSLG